MSRNEGLLELSRILAVLASPTRLRLLHALREPQALHEIRAEPSRSRRDERVERALSRQATTHHLRRLEAAGVIRRVADDRYVLDHARLFASIDALRNLGQLRPAEPSLAAVPGTEMAEPAPHVRLPPPPRLHIAYGAEDAVAFALSASPGQRWTIGRDEMCNVRLDHDLLASGRHAEVERSTQGFRVRDVGSRNGTRLSWDPLLPDEWRPLPPGALLRIGRTILVLEE